MTEEQAKEYLTNNYICCCPYGTSPTKCGDDMCKFGQAIRALTKGGDKYGTIPHDST